MKSPSLKICEFELYENLKEKEELKEKIKALLKEKDLLNQDILSIKERNSISIEAKDNLREKIKSNNDHFHIVFEDSISLMPLYKLFESKTSDNNPKEMITLLTNAFNKDITPSNIKLILNEVNESKNLKAKYLESMRTYLELKKDYDQN